MGAQVSPDGKFWWDGAKWNPMPTSASNVPQFSADKAWWWTGSQWVPSQASKPQTSKSPVVPARIVFRFPKWAIVPASIVAGALVLLISGMALAAVLGGGSSRQPSSNPAAANIARSPSPISTLAPSPSPSPTQTLSSPSPSPSPSTSPSPSPTPPPSPSAAALATCTVQINDHNMMATAIGPSALAICKEWLQLGHGVSYLSGTVVCDYNNGSTEIVVRDTGLALWGHDMCDKLKIWATNGGSVPQLDGSIATTPIPSPSPRVLVDLTGSGIKNSAPFNAPSQWTLTYSYDCSSFGDSGNFIVSLYQGNSPVDVLVNELSLKGSASTTAYDGGNNMHLEIISECSWHVKAIG